jgi:hypothetical protein
MHWIARLHLLLLTARSRGRMCAYVVMGWRHVCVCCANGECVLVRNCERMPTPTPLTIRVTLAVVLQCAWPSFAALDCVQHRGVRCHVWVSLKQ